MPKWISLKTLLTKWDIEIFEIFVHLQNGLQPYTKLGFPFHCPESHHSWHKMIKKIRGIENKLDILKSNRFSQYKTKVRLSEDPEEIENDLRRECQKLQNEVELIEKNNDDREHCSWKYFINPNNEEEIEELLSKLKNAIFKLTDVERYESNFGTIRMNKLTEVFSKNGYKIEDQAVKLINEAREEIEIIYEAIKSVGFSGRLSDPEKKWRAAALNQFRKSRDKFNYIKEEYLEDNNLYLFDSSQAKRDFIGRILKLVTEDNNIPSIGARRLYEIYKSTRRPDFDQLIDQ
jgi:hypothetical protein